MVNYSFEPIFTWKDGEILFRSRSKLAWYNPEMKKSRVVTADGDVITSTKYIPRFYSLKTIMGDDFQPTNVYPKTKIVRVVVLCYCLWDMIFCFCTSTINFYYFVDAFEFSIEKY